MGWLREIHDRWAAVRLEGAVVRIARGNDEVNGRRLEQESGSLEALETHCAIIHR
jgi:hypothetical protein